MLPWPERPAVASSAATPSLCRKSCAKRHTPVGSIMVMWLRAMAACCAASAAERLVPPLAVSAPLAAAAPPSAPSLLLLLLLLSVQLCRMLVSARYCRCAESYKRVGIHSRSLSGTSLEACGSLGRYCMMASSGVLCAAEKSSSALPPPAAAAAAGKYLAGRAAAVHTQYKCRLHDAWNVREISPAAALVGNLAIAVSMVCVAGIGSAGTGDLREDARQVRGHALRLAQCASDQKDSAW